MGKNRCRFMSVFAAIIYMMTLLVGADGFSHMYSSDTDFTITVLVIIAVPAVVAFVMMSVKMQQMKTAVKKHSANDYMKAGSLRIDRANDIYLYSNTVRTPRPKAKK